MGVRLTPGGRLEVPASASASEERRFLEDAAGRGTPELLAALARHDGPDLGPALRFWSEFAKGYLRQFCSVTGFEPLSPPSSWADRLASAPPMQGGEYLDGPTLDGLWRGLDSWVVRTRRPEERKSEFLERCFPGWHQVGRVHLNLALNLEDSSRPFAFLATYTDGLAAGGKPVHRRLASALSAAAEAGDHARLDRLIEPLKRAAENSQLMRRMLESRAIFSLQAWDADQAYEFLRQEPVWVAAGLRLRLPDWWRRRVRIQVQLTVGEGAPSGLGTDGILSFDPELHLAGEPVDPEAVRALADREEGLAFLNGRWIEVRGDRIRALLARWDAVREAGTNGMTLGEALRLAAGVGLSNDGAESGEDAVGLTELRAGRWLRARFDALRSPPKHPRRAIVGGSADLRGYQSAGVEWLDRICSAGFGACLADDMGLGKTLQVLAWLAAKQRELGGPALVVAPASLLRNWRVEAARFVPGFSVFVAHPSEVSRADLDDIVPERLSEDLVLTSYEMAGRLGWIREATWGAVVLDEAQLIKNPATRAAKAVKALRAPCRVALTGTPIENRPDDLWSLFDFLSPGLLGSRRAFGRFLQAADRDDGSRFRGLRRLIGPFLLRRKKTDPEVAPELPSKTELKSYCRLTAEQVTLYQAVVDELASGLAASAGIARRGMILGALSRLQKVCNHPSHLAGDGGFEERRSGKFRRLAELAAEIHARQERLLVFTQSRRLVRPLAQRLEAVFGRPGLELHGGVAVAKRAELVDRFGAPDGPPFFVLTTKVGGVGLNLTAANHVVHFDRWWNPAVEDQATDRAFRIGQRRPVMVHKLICCGTVEERVDQLLTEKAAVAQEVLGGSTKATSEEQAWTELADAALLELVRLDGGYAET